MESVDTKEAVRIRYMCNITAKHKIIFLLLMVIYAHSVFGGMDNSVDCNMENKLVKKFLNEQTGETFDFAGYQKIDKKLSVVIPYCKNHADLNRSIANIQISLGKNMEALKYADIALSLQPNNPEGIHLKGVIYSLIGNKNDSIKYIEKSLELEPSNIDFLVNYCSTLEMFSMYKKAVNACSKAIQHKESPPIVFYIRGRANESLGDKEKANADYKKAKELGFKLPEKPM